MQIINRHAEKPSLSPSDERQLPNQVLVSRYLNMTGLLEKDFFGVISQVLKMPFATHSIVTVFSIWQMIWIG